MNKFIGLGRITKDIEIETYNDTKVARFNLAINRKGGKDKEKEADFIPCTAFNKTAENIAKFFGRGNLIAIEGRLQINSYKDKDGNNRTGVAVIVESFSFCGEAKKENADQSVDIESELASYEAVDDDLPF